MKDIFKNYPELLVLSQFIEAKLALLPQNLQKKYTPPKPPIALRREQQTPEQAQFTRNHAARTIQRIWRNFRVKQTFITNAYTGYLSLIDKNDEQRLLSLIMFGRHQAEIKASSSASIANPYQKQSSVFYHRSEFLYGELLNNLIKQFKLSKSVLTTHNVIAITRLNTAEVEFIINTYCPKAAYTLSHSSTNTISLLQIPKDSDLELTTVIRASGLVASPWEIAMNLDEAYEVNETANLSLDKKLPANYQQLARSTIFSKLRRIAHNSQYPTHKLAQCILNLIDKTPFMQEDAIKRIALVLDMTTTFYANNYARFAFCVYVVVHELSLTLIKTANTNQIEAEYHNFLKESEETTLKMLGLNKSKLNGSELVACTAISGTHAYMIALQLANKMMIPAGGTPKLKTYSAQYYEYEAITREDANSDADIYIFSAGPIVTEDGTVPGVDINQFIKRNISDAQRNTPVVLVIDATTALYKNLKLTAESKVLVETGMVSIIIHESHQKFGLIHTDQAQHGRLLALCAKQSFSAKTISDLNHNAQVDFANHVDMRVGAYISTQCSALLEDIKQQHFNNGAILRNIFMLTTLVKEKIVSPDELMLSNLDELYFVTFGISRGSDHLFTMRDSFGHFHSSQTMILKSFTRISPDASDTIDILMQTAQMYLNFQPSLITNMLQDFNQITRPLALSEQIIGIALLSVLNEPYYRINDLSVYCLILKMIKRCDQLQGRRVYEESLVFLDKLKKQIIKEYQPYNPVAFFKLLELLFPHPFDWTEYKLIASMKNNKPFIQFITQHKDTLSKEQQYVACIVASPSGDIAKFYPQILKEQFCKKVVLMQDTMNLLISSLRAKPSLQILVTKHAKTYLASNCMVLNEYFSQAHPTARDRHILFKGLEFSINQFMDNTVEQDKNTFMKLGRTLIDPVYFMVGKTSIFKLPVLFDSKNPIQILYDMHQYLEDTLSAQADDKNTRGPGF